MQALFEHICAALRLGDPTAAPGELFVFPGSSNGAVALGKGSNSKLICANVDLYSGFVYETLGIPQDLYTPLFAAARIAGWIGHRMEEVTTNARIMRPAYKCVIPVQNYCPISERTE